MSPRPWDRGLSRKHRLDAIDGSLRRLRTDDVDLYQAHHPDPETPIDETLRALKRTSPSFPYNPIAGGFLSGKQRRDTGPLPGTRFVHPGAGPTYRDRYWHDGEFDTVEALRPLARNAGMSMTQMAIGPRRQHSRDEPRPSSADYS